MVITATIAGVKKTFLLGSREGAPDLQIEVFSESSPSAAPSAAARPATR